MKFKTLKNLDLAGIKKDNFPVFFNEFFLKGFSELRTSSFLLYKSYGKHQSYFVVMVKKIKFLKTIQFLSVPLNINGEKFSSEVERNILNEFINYIKINKVFDRVLQPANWVLFSSFPRNSINVSFGTYLIDLSYSLEHIFKSLHHKHRNVIRNARNKQVVIKSGKDQVIAFYSLYKSTMHRNSMYCEPLSYFKNLYTKENQNILCSVAYSKNGISLGGLYIIYNKTGAYYLYGCSKLKVNVTGAINLLHFEVINILKQKGVRKYDFVGARLSDIKGTKLEGIQNFKKRFGGELIKGYLWKKDINKFRCFIFDKLIALKFILFMKTPLKDIIDQELTNFQKNEV